MKNFNKFFGLAGVIFTGFFVFSAGMDAEHHWYQSMTLNLLLGTFWLVLAGFMIADWQLNKEEKRAREFAETVTKAMDKALSSVDEMVRDGKPSEDDHHDQMSKTLMECIDAVTGGDRPPFKKEMAAIKKMFNEKTGHFVEINVVPGGMEIHIASDEKTLKEKTAKKPRTNRSGSMDVVKSVKPVDATKRKQ